METLGISNAMEIGIACTTFSLYRSATGVCFFLDLANAVIFPLFMSWV